jgi:hypothetical protein
VDYGSRLGLLSRDQSVLAAWTDARDSLGSAQEVFKSAAQDIFTTQVVFPGGEAASGAPGQVAGPPGADADEGPDVGWIALLVGAGALVAAAAGILLGRRRRARRAGGERPA